MKRCRLCGEKLSLPVLKFSNMPKAAQYMPTKLQIKDEHGIDIQVFECDMCGLLQLGNEPVDYYKDVIRASGVSHELREYLYSRFVSFAEEHNLAGKKVLEVGCGDGTYLKVLQDANMEAVGVENGLQYLDIKGKGLKALQGFFDGEYECEERNFSAFFMFNYLEHLPNPRATLSNIARVLDEDAVGIVEVPNLDMMMEKELYTEFTADHLCYYDKRTLRLLLELSGFDVLEFQSVRDDYVLSAIVKKRRKLNFDDGMRHLNEMLEDVQNYVDSAKSVAIWGAGHQAFTLLAMLKDLSKINCIVDSAKFKQGKYSPSTHIEILPPDTLNSRVIDTIIIIAGSYNHEIARLVKSKYPQIRAAVLKEKGIEEV